MNLGFGVVGFGTMGGEHLRPLQEEMGRAFRAGDCDPERTRAPGQGGRVFPDAESRKGALDAPPQATGWDGSAATAIADRIVPAARLDRAAALDGFEMPDCFHQARK